jgi:HEAT repeat protein
MRKKVFLYVIILFVLFLVILLVAQERTGRILGTVVDADGNPIPGVTVTLLATAGAPTQAVTTAEGSFRFLALLPSTGYALKAELEGFKTVIKTGIIVDVGQTTEMNLVMEMGELDGEVVTVYSREVPHRGLHKQMQLTKEQIEAFRSAKTVRIVVEQSYQDNKDRDLEHVRLPIDYVAGKFLRFIGLQVLSPDARNDDLEIKIITKGTTNVFYGKISPPVALLTSEISFKMANVPIYAATIYSYSSVYRKDLREKTSDLIKARRNPFSVDELAHELVDIFEGDIIELMAEIFGISSVIARLSDKNVAVRKYAAASLRHIRDQRVIELLIACTKDRDKNVRTVAIESLSRIDDPRAVEPLIEALKHENEAVRAAAVESLGHLEDERAVKPLISALKDEDKDVRVATARSLSYPEDEQVVEPLITCLKDADKDVRIAAINSLDYHSYYNEDPRIISSIKSCLKDEDKDVKAAALDTLIYELDDTEEEDLLIAALTDKAGIVRATVLKRIFHLLEDDKRAVEYSLAALTDKNGLVRAAAAGSLYSYHGDDPRVVESLIASLKDEEADVRIAATWSLSEFYKDPRVANSLIGALNDKSELVRAAAAGALGYLDDDSLVAESLTDILNDKSELVRATVLEALSYSDNPRVIESLIAALKSKDEDFRMDIDETLETITSKSFDGNRRKWQKWWKENKEEFIKERRI